MARSVTANRARRGVAAEIERRELPATPCRQRAASPGEENNKGNEFAKKTPGARAGVSGTGGEDANASHRAALEPKGPRLGERNQERKNKMNLK